MVRAKFTCTSLTKHAWPGTTVVLAPVYDTTIPADQRFAKATPSGKLEMHVDNPQAESQFELGEAYHLDIAPA